MSNEIIAPIMPGMPGIQQPQVHVPVMPGIQQQQVPVQPQVQVPQMQVPVQQEQAQPQVQVPQMQVPVQQEYVQPEVQVPIQQEYVQPEVQVPEMINIVAEISEPVQQEIVPIQQDVVNTLREESMGNVSMPNIPMGGLDLQGGVMSPEEEVKLNQEQVEVKPISINGLQPIATCKSSAWGAFLKVLDFLAKDSSKDEVIMVEQGTLDTNKNGVFVHCDLKNILGDVTLNITAPSYSTKLLKTIKGGEFVQILKEDATNSYVFCNIVDGRMFTKVRTKYAAGDVDNFAKPPVLPEPIYQKEVSASDKEIIKTIIEGKAAIESDEPYRFGFAKSDNSLVSIGVGKDFTHYFQDSNIAVDEYKVYYPFPVSRMDSCIIKLFKCQDGSTWLKTVNNVELASIICTEKIEVIDSSIEDFSF